jgi:signal transduction histidine kinase
MIAYLVPVTTAQRRLLGEDHVDRIFVQAVSKDLIKTAIREVRSLLRDLHDLSDSQAVSRNHGIGMIIVIDGERIAFGRDGESIDPDVLTAESGSLRRIEVSSHAGPQYIFYLNHEKLNQENKSLLFGLILLLLITIGMVYAIQLSLLRPLKWLRSGVEAVSQGDFSTRVPVVRNDEIGRVARSFNQMTGRVRQMMDDRERLLADVSHELRSPLARIKVALELLPGGEKRDSISQDIREMEALITALLEREQVRNKAGGNGIAQDRINLVTLAAEVIDGFGKTTPGIELDLPPERVEINADTALIKVLVQNLIDNAVKFSLADSGPVQVSLRQVDKSVEIVVVDDGQGIPEQKARKVFEPFVKLNPARGHRAGYGLGLNLCHRIVQSLGGSIEILQREQRGTKVRVVLPG